MFKNTTGTGFGCGTGGIHLHLSRKRQMDTAALPLGMGPVWAAIRAALLPAAQLFRRAGHLNRQYGYALQPPEQIGNPAGILPDDMIRNDQRSGPCRCRDAGMKGFDKRKSGVAQSRQYGFVASCTRTQKLINGQHHAACSVCGLQFALQGSGQRGFPRA